MIKPGFNPVSVSGKNPLHFSEPQFSILLNEENNSTYLSGISWELQEITYVKSPSTTQLSPSSQGTVIPTISQRTTLKNVFPSPSKVSFVSKGSTLNLI